MPALSFLSRRCMRVTAFRNHRNVSEASVGQKEFDPKSLEEKWKNHVLEPHGPESTKGKYYILSMFPYPSGVLHMGHARVYTMSDCIARFRRSLGHNVIHPMGFDAFGLPAENTARAKGIPPAIWTYSNMDSMKVQMKALGLNFDWEREVITCDPEYYKWTQWLFLKMFKQGLAYRKEAEVNWCPVDQTVLANEQVDAQGKSWRSGALVEKKLLNQWFLKITAFSKELHENLDSMNWPSNVKEMQRQWIGISEGGCFDFNLEDAMGKRIDGGHFKIFTTRPETIHGSTFVGIAPNHPILRNTCFQDKEEEISKLRELVKAQKNAEVSVENAVLTNVNARCGFTSQTVPVIVCPYVVDDYATGAIMGVPAHDSRDADLANAIDLDVVEIINEEGLLVNSGKYSGMAAEVAAREILVEAQKREVGTADTVTKLRDWLISRQRYWGTPIPMVYCNDCGDIPVSEEELPVMLPEVSENLKLEGSNLAPLATLSDWTSCACPKCGKPAQRCTDTMDTFVDSSWYYMRYLDAKNKDEICSRQFGHQLPVDLYIGGIEHAVLHLLYARFMCNFIESLDVGVPKEPFKQLLIQGLVHGLVYEHSENKKILREDEVEKCIDGFVEKGSNAPVNKIWQKMSKSKGNGVDPTDIVQRFGADTTRAFVLFKAPPEAVLEWDSEAVNGVYRWLRRVWSGIQETNQYVQDKGIHGGSPSSKVNDLQNYTQESVNSVTKAFSETYRFNTVVSTLMKLTRELRSVPLEERNNKAYIDCWRTMLVLLSPVCPHIACELWEDIESSCGCEATSVLNQPWPKYKEIERVEDTVEIKLQVGGRFRGSVAVPTEVLQSGDNERLMQLVQESMLFQKWVKSSERIKTIVIPPGKNIISIVIKK
eukprot:m.119936 g.119936  ORF g.119936 m.119936 type:complete len:881 (+) comp14340_c1_seq1:286-2928(+)